MGVAEERKAGHLWIRRQGGSDRNADDPERPAFQRDPITRRDVERLGKGGFEHHTAVSHPAPLGQLGLVDRCRRDVTADNLRAQRTANCT
jgi:hypothetical protein